jgi:hypothetical protein
LAQGKKNGEKRGGCGEKVKNGGEKKLIHPMHRKARRL